MKNRISIILILILVIVIGIGINQQQNTSTKIPSGLFLADVNGTQNATNNYSYISIQLLSHISLYGENYLIQANSSSTTVIVAENSAEVYSQGLNRLTVEYGGANQFAPMLFTNHINQNFLLKNLTGTRIIINDYSYRLNTSFTIIYSVQVMTVSNYRSYISNHLIPPQEQFSYFTMIAFTEYNGLWILSMLVILTLVEFTVISEKKEQESDKSVLE